MDSIGLGKFAKILLVVFLFSIKSAVGQNSVVVDARSQGQNFNHIWSKCVGAGRANEGLRAGWLEQLALAKQNCGFEYIRFHGLFHDDMFVYSEKEGKAVYNWQYVDELYDRLLKIGVKPFVEFGFFPKDIAAKDTKKQFWWGGNITPDENSYNKWEQLITAFTHHIIARYGIDEVRTWYFEVWNEPNLYNVFWGGTKSDYFKLYKVSVNAIKKIDSKLRVGGPSTSNFVADDRYSGEIEDRKKHVIFSQKDINKADWKGAWIEDFLKYCKKEKLPLDFISCHPYPTDFALDFSSGGWKGSTRELASTSNDIAWLQSQLIKSAYPNAEIHLTEWSSSPSPRDYTHDHLPAAAYIIDVNLKSIGKANSLSYWTFTDVFEEKPGAPTIYHGGFGMINFQGIVKPSYHAYRMLNQLGDIMLYNKNGLAVTKNSKSNKVTAIAYNYPDEMNNQSIPTAAGNFKSARELQDIGSSKDFEISLTGLSPNAIIQIEVLDKNHGNGIESWHAMGKPEPPTREQIQVLKNQAMTTLQEIYTADDKGNFKISKKIAPWSVVLIKETDLKNQIKS